MLFIRTVPGRYHLHSRVHVLVVIVTAIQIIWTARNDKVFNDISLGMRQLINKFKYHKHFYIKCDNNRLTNDQFRQICCQQTHMRQHGLINYYIHRDYNSICVSFCEVSRFQRCNPSFN